MTLQDEKRRSLLCRLSRQLGYTAPAALLVISGAAAQAVAGETSEAPGFTSSQEAPLMLAEGSEEGDAEAEGEEEEEEAEGESEAEG